MSDKNNAERVKTVFLPAQFENNKDKSNSTKEK